MVAPPSKYRAPISSHQVENWLSFLRRFPSGMEGATPNLLITKLHLNECFLLYLQRTKAVQLFAFISRRKSSLENSQRRFCIKRERLRREDSLNAGWDSSTQILPFDLSLLLSRKKYTWHSSPTQPKSGCLTYQILMNNTNRAIPDVLRTKGKVPKRSWTAALKTFVL